MSYTSELTEKDIQNMETFIELVLDDYKLGKLSKSQAISGITHVMVALELDNYTEAAFFKIVVAQSCFKQPLSAPARVSRAAPDLASRHR